jgi:hypothetical protein
LPDCEANIARLALFAQQTGGLPPPAPARYAHGYPGSGLRVRVAPFSLPIFADVSIFTRNFYPFSRGKPWSTRNRQTGTGDFCLLFVGRLNSKKFQHLTQINNEHMLVKVFNNLWRTSTAKVAIL